MITALLVDDEKGNRDSLQKLLKQHCADVHVLGEASSAAEGAQLIRKLRPQLVFLDVVMPGHVRFRDAGTVASN